MQWVGKVVDARPGCLRNHGTQYPELNSRKLVGLRKRTSRTRGCACTSEATRMLALRRWTQFGAKSTGRPPTRNRGPLAARVANFGIRSVHFWVGSPGLTTILGV